MLKEKLSDLIKKAMLEKNQIALETFRSVKTAFMNFETAKNAKPLDDAAEIQILRKMVAQREESIEQYKQAGRIESAEQEMEEIKILSSFLPTPVSKEDVENFAKTLVTPEMTKKDMGKLVKEVKEKFPTAEGKLVADVVKNLLP
jgi:uncharacterized protein YqeY